MAKKKHAAKRRTTRRRSVGAVSKSGLMDVAATIGGYVVGNMLQSKVAPTMDAKIKGAATAAVGIFVVPMFLKSSFGKALGIGIATSGGVEILKSTGVISGIGVRQLPYNVQGNRLLAGPGINQMVGARDGINQMVGASKRPYSSAMQNALKYG